MIAGRDEPAPRGAPAALASAKARARRAGVGPREHRKRRAVAGARGWGPAHKTRKRIAVTTLHITNGDCAANTLRQFLTDPVSITADVLHEGPAPRVDLETWHQLRAILCAAAHRELLDDPPRRSSR